MQRLIKKTNKKALICSPRFLLVDLCHPLLVGVLPHHKERESPENRKEVFLCVKQRLVLEVDVQSGRERSRLELDSLTRVETKEEQWNRGVKMKNRKSS